MKHHIPLDILVLANAAAETRGRVDMAATRDPLVLAGEVVGFVTPHETRWGWRHGPIYVLEAHRRHGLVLGYYRAHPERACVAFVSDTNPASRGLHERAGFTNWRRGNRGWFMRRAALALALALESRPGPGP